MPDDVAARLESTIATLAAAPAFPAPRQPESRRTGRRRATALTAILGAAAVAVGAVVLTTTTVVSTAGNSGTVAGAVTSDERATAATPTAAPRPSGTANAGFNVPLHVVASGTAYRGEALLGQVITTMRLALGGAPEATPDARAGSPAETSQALRDCARAVTGGSDAHVSVVDLATYESRPVAVLVVWSSASEPPTAWVVGRDCDGDTPALVTSRVLVGMDASD